MVRLKFHRKDMPIMVEHRPIYKITQILLILYLASRGKKSSSIRLHFFNWVMKNETKKQILLSHVENDRIPFGAWGIDPVLDYSLQFAIAEKLMTKESNLSYKLTQNGIDYISEVEYKNFLKEDQVFLRRLGPTVTEKMVEEVTRKWESLG